MHSLENRITTLVWYAQEQRRVRTTVYYVGKGTKATGIVEINGKIYNVRYTGVWKTI